MICEKRRVVHGFATKFGGVSRSPYIGDMNLGFSVGEERGVTLENYRIFASSAGCDFSELLCANQTHTTNVLTVDRSHRGMGLSRTYAEVLAGTPNEAMAEEGFDGLVTRETNVALVVRAADCVPILFCDPEHGVIGACHAGWRGTVGGIAREVVLRMCALGAHTDTVHAAIGPSIGGCCYEVDDAFRETFLHTLGEELCANIFYKSPSHENPDKFHCDLKTCNRLLLEAAGVLPSHITVSEDCTCCMHDTYHSHRYAMKHQGGRRGLGGGIICMAEH